MTLLISTCSDCDSIVPWSNLGLSIACTVTPVYRSLARRACCIGDAPRCLIHHY